MSFPPHHIHQNMTSYLLGDYKCSLAAQEEIVTPGSWPETKQGTRFTSTPIEDCTVPNHDLSENQGYSRLLIEQYQIDARKNPLLDSLAGVFSEEPQPDLNLDDFSMANTVDSEYGGDAMANRGNYHDPSPLPLPTPKLPVPPSSIPISNDGKKHACTHCGKLFDRWTRARDCAYKALDQTPHQCGGRCGNVACTFATSSEQLLTEHLNPRSVACPLCSVMASKKNLARHQKETCVNRSLPANAHS